MVPLQSSSLPADILSQIWDLADVDRDGELNAAETHWKEAAALEPENSQAKMYLRMLERTRTSQPPT